MPVGYAPAYTPAGGTVSIPGAVAAAGGVLAGAAVALAHDGTNPVITLCSGQSHGDKFFGFAVADADAGATVTVKTTRGSRVTPITVGGVALVPNARVYLSAIPGQVTQTPPALNVAGTFIQVGLAVTETDMVLITDARFGIPG